MMSLCVWSGSSSSSCDLGLGTDFSTIKQGFPAGNSAAMMSWASADINQGQQVGDADEQK